MFSRERIMSILMLLAILIISLVFASYREGLAGIEDVNKEAPKADADADTSKADTDTSKAVADASKADTDASKAVADASKVDASNAPNALPKDGILLGKPSTLTVAEITGALKNNPGVQKLIDNKTK